MPDEISKASFDPGWLRSIRIATLGPIALAIGYSLWSSSPALRRGCTEDRSFAAWVLWVVTPTAIFSLSHLIRKPDPARKKGLAWAVVAGAAWGILGLVVGGLMLSDRSFRGAVLPFISSAIQLGLAACGARTYYSGPRQKGDAGILFKRVGGFIAYFIVAASVIIALPDLWATTRNSRADSAVDALRKIKAAEIYTQKYGKGFSPSLAALGPPSPNAGAGPSEAAAGLITPDLARGTSTEYAIHYTPGAPGADGKIATYVLTAQPLEPECARWKRFSTDQTGRIHVNTNGQPATVADPSL